MAGSARGRARCATVERVAVIALIVILLNGGMDTGWRRFRAAAGPIMAIGMRAPSSPRRVLTGAAHWLLGMDWKLAGVVGAALAPTDPAVVFSVLGGREIGGRSGTTLEGEAGVNDPAGIALMIGVIELATHDDATFLVIVEDFVVEMAIGLVFGLAGRARGARPAPRPAAQRSPLPGVRARSWPPSLYAVDVAGRRLGLPGRLRRRALPRRRVDPVQARDRALPGLAGRAGGDRRLHRARASPIDITDLPGQTWLHGAVLALVLAVLARPLAVALTLTGSSLSRAERVFIAWSGLKGAVPILLAAFAILGGVDGARNVYGLVFVVVLLSVLGQGTLVPSVARRLGIPMHDHPAAPVAALGRPQREAPRRTRVLHDPRRGRRRTNHRRPATGTRATG